MLERSEQEIMCNWGQSSAPLLSICCPTFNHESYIEEALDSFLVQETDFPFEIIVRDDCSTDRTALILKSYEKKYPRLIKPIFEKENQYSKGESAAAACMKYAVGDYIALCEGDDHWTDKNKLQTQVDFLEKNKVFVVSGHDAYVINADGEIIQESKLPARFKKNFDNEDLILKKAWILTMSMVFRNVIKGDFPYEFRMVKNRDTFLMSMLGNYGKSKYHSDINSACYRAQDGGIWSLLPKQDKKDSLLNTEFWLYRYYCRVGEEKYAKYFLKQFYRMVLSRVAYRLIIKEVFNRMTGLFKK